MGAPARPGVPAQGSWSTAAWGPRSEHRRAGVHAPAAPKGTGSAPAGRPTRRRRPPAPGARGLREGASRAKVTQRPARGLGPRPQRTCLRAEGGSPDPPAAPPPRAARRPAPPPRAPQLTSPHLVVVVSQPPPRRPSRGRLSSAGPASGARSPASRSTSREKSRSTEGPRRLRRSRPQCACALHTQRSLPPSRCHVAPYLRPSIGPAPRLREPAPFPSSQSGSAGRGVGSASRGSRETPLGAQRGPFAFTERLLFARSRPPDRWQRIAKLSGRGLGRVTELHRGCPRSVQRVVPSPCVQVAKPFSEGKIRM